MDGQFEKVVAVKQQSHRSWKNLYAAANKELGLPYSFSTDKVEEFSMYYLSEAVDKSGLTVSEIKAEIEKRGLL